MHTNDEISIRPAQSSDIEQMVDIMNLVYNRKKSKDYFLWQYFNAPIPSVSFCAFHRNQLIGISGIQKKKLTNELVIGQAIDSVMLPEWRGKGVFQSLCSTALEFFEDLDALVAFTNLAGTNAYVKYFKWQKIYKINSFVLIEENFRDGLTFLSQNRKSHLPFNFQYTETFQNWRFEKSPVYSYKYIYLKKDIYSVVKLFTSPLDNKVFGDIVFFNCHLDNTSSLMKLFTESCNKLFEMGCDCITTWSMPNLVLTDILSNIGFVEEPQERYFIVKGRKEYSDDLYNINNWHLVQSDAEIY